MALKEFDRIVTAATILVVAFIVVSTMLPALRHYWVSVDAPESNVVEILERTPSDSALSDPALGPLIGPPVEDREGVIARANGIVRGDLDLPGFGDGKITLPFSGDDLEKGTGSAHLQFASLVAPDALVRAYEITSDLRYLKEAQEMIVAFSEYERHAWLNKGGFLWNDHAVAARMNVLIRFWKSYRSSSILDASAAKEVLWHASRCAAFLARPDHFTFATNHGVMQNVALLQYAYAFPAMRNTKQYRDLAIERLTQQFRYYVDDEGVVLEHSAGYHSAGVDLIEKSIRLADLMHAPVPEAWRDKYRRARAFLAALVRPDGTLPVFGDTHDGSKEGIQPAETGAPLTIWPVSGYAVWHHEAADQTVDAHAVALWSYFPGHGHKVADEMSLILWARGRSWINNTGYWPYDVPGRKRAVGWLGSNAPHAIDERAGTVRHTDLLGYMRDGDVTALDMRRQTDGGDRHRRQIISLSGSLWLVVDNGSIEPSETLWTFPADLSLTETSAGRFTVLDQASRDAMTVSISGGQRLLVLPMRGSHDPFGGWVVADRQVVPAPALLVQAFGENNWSVAVFALGNRTLGAVTTTMTDGDNWKVESARGNESWAVGRIGNQLTVTDGNASRTAAFETAPDVSKQRDEIAAALSTTASEFPRYRDIDVYRERVALLAMVALFLQEAAFFVLNRVRFKWLPHLRGMALLAWILMAWWLRTTYLV